MEQPLAFPPRFGGPDEKLVKGREHECVPVCRCGWLSSLHNWALGPGRERKSKGVWEGLRDAGSRVKGISRRRKSCWPSELRIKGKAGDW